MDKLDDALLNRIQNVLGIKFHKWQRNYLLNEPMLLDMRITGRCTGKTLVYILKLLFSSDEPLIFRNRRDVAKICDWWCCHKTMEESIYSPYPDCFINFLKEIFEKLKKAGIKTRNIEFKRMCEGVDNKVKNASEKEIYIALGVPPELLKDGSPNKESAEIQLNQFIELNKTTIKMEGK